MRDYKGCRQVVCWCHDTTAPALALGECTSCGCVERPPRNVSAAETERREKAQAPRLGYPGAEQMMRWQRDYK